MLRGLLLIASWRSQASGVRPVSSSVISSASSMALRSSVSIGERSRYVSAKRLRIIERRDVSMENLHASIASARRDYPDQPTLVVVDYVQIMDNEERDIRRRVARAMEELDALANEHHAVVLALSQGSRASSRQLASGEKIGRETADAGAEAAGIERWSVNTIAIGGHAPTESDWSAVDLSVGKGRIGGGDVVYPARYCGRTGAWRLEGDARSAAEVKPSARRSRPASAWSHFCTRSRASSMRHPSRCPG